MRTVLIAPFLLQISVLVGLTGYLSWLSGQKTVESMALRLSEEVTAHIEQHIQNYTNTPVQFLEVNEAAVQSGLLDLNDFDRMARYFWKQTQISDAAPYLYYANRQGDFLGVWRQSDSLTTLRRRTAAIAPNRDVYRLDSHGQSVERLFRKPYEPRERPWYQAAVTEGQATWSPIYVFSEPLSLGLTRVIPLFDDAKRLTGVLAADITLWNLSQFLQQIEVSKTGHIFIIEPSGDIVASSSADPPFQVTDQGERRLLASQSSDRLIRHTAQQLTERFSDFDQIQDRQQLALTVESERQFVEITPIQLQHGLSWIMVVVIPEADFTEYIRDNNRITLLLCVGSLLLATAIGVRTSSWLAQPLQNLGRASHALAEQMTPATFQLGQSLQPVSQPRIHELGVLAKAFNRMAKQLQQSFSELAQLNEVLEQKVAERTDSLAQANQELERSIRKDDLTQVGNRRRLSEYLEEVWRQQLRTHNPLSLIICDVDSFKAYNDTYGHPAGDTCLRGLAHTMTTVINRPADLVARYGGEEFVIVLPQTDLVGAQQVAEALRQQIYDLNIPHRTSAIADRVTMSLGVSCCSVSRKFSTETLLARADQALYQAKRQGRNQVVALPLVSESLNPRRDEIDAGP